MIAQNLDDAYRAFDPLRPLSGESLQAYYVARERNPIDHIRAILLRTPETPDKILFTGHRGCGKSTEINRLLSDPDIQQTLLVAENLEWLAEPLSLDDEGLAALNSLATSLAQLRGRPGLILAFYDSPLLRDRIIAEAQARLPALTLVTLEAEEDQPDLLPWLAETIPPNADGVFVLAATERLSATARYLNYRREILAGLHCPVVMWFPTHLEASLRQQAPDFWAFRRHAFVFRLHTPWVLQVSQKITQAGQGDLETLQASIAVHRQLIHDLEQTGAARTKLAAILRRNLGDLLLQAQVWPEARQQLEQALVILHNVEADSGEIAHTHLSLGRTLYYLDEHNLALGHYEQSLALFKQVGDRLNEARVLQAIGDVLAFLDVPAKGS